MFVKKSITPFGMFVVVTALLFMTTNTAQAAPIDDFPVTVTQPDGTVLNLFASGDEFYNWLQDAQGYIVIQDPDTGYYVYADLVNGKLTPTKAVAGRTDPASVGLRPYLNISPEQRGEIRQTFLDQTKQATGEVINAPTTGTINNLVVFIRFSGESEFTNATSTYTDMLNNSTAGANSLWNYYREVSYNALTVNSTLFPTPGTIVVSYQDSHTRGYYQPYNATTNPGGYTGGDNGTDRRVREHTLLKDAITYVNSLGQFPSGASIDGDGDGYVDSLTFIVSGSPTGWSSLLWPHQWSLYSYTVTINEKRAYGYSFQLNSMLYTGVLAHEMFHVLGSPDLYHYSQDGLQPVGGWDVMENDAIRPQHMGCYMKFRYGRWISSIPQLSAAGTYSLNPLTSSTNNCKKIASPNSTTEYFVVEYRNKTAGMFESSLPGTGLLVYRINTLATGNASGPPDEVYIYRPGGTISVNGSVSTANFSSNVGRTAINDSTNPSSFLSSGSAGGLNICNVGASNATISFDICSTPGFTLTVGKTGTGSGTVIAAYGTGTVLLPAPITNIAHGTVITLTAVPSTTSIFAGWSGAAVTTTNPLVLTMDANKAVTATFNLIPITYYTLTVNKTGTGQGAVIAAYGTGTVLLPGTAQLPMKITNIVSGAVIALTATPSTTSVFAGWSGVVVTPININPLVLTIAANKVVTATFNLNADLSVTENIDRAGSAITYTIVARNAGPGAAGGAVVSSIFPAEVINVTWICTGSGGAVCGDSGSGNSLADALTTFPAGGVVNYTVRGTLGLLTTGNNVVTIAPPSGVVDHNPNNNLARVYRLLLPIVFKN